LLPEHLHFGSSYKRLDEGTFPIVHAADGKAVEITHRDLASLLANAEMMSSVPAAS